MTSLPESVKKAVCYIYTHTYINIYLYIHTYINIYIYSLDFLHCMKFTGMHDFMHCMVIFLFFPLLFFVVFCHSFLIGFLKSKSCEPCGLMFESCSRPQGAVSQLVRLFGHKKAHSPPPSVSDCHSSYSSFSSSSLPPLSSARSE